jgi:hypothetical protein
MPPPPPHPATPAAAAASAAGVAAAAGAGAVVADESEGGQSVGMDVEEGQRCGRAIGPQADKLLAAATHTSAGAVASGGGGGGVGDEGGGHAGAASASASGSSAHAAAGTEGLAADAEHPGTPCACFTGTKVQILTQKECGGVGHGRRRHLRRVLGTQCTCFTGTKVQILTRRKALVGYHLDRAEKSLAMLDAMELVGVLVLLALLVQKYKY